MQPIDYFGMAMKHADAGEAAGDRFLGALRQAKADKREDIKHERYEAYHDAISQGADPQQVMQQFPEFAGETAAHYKQVQAFRDNDMGRKAAMLSQALKDPNIDNTQALSAFATELANSDPNDEFTPETTLQLLQGPQGGEVLNMVAKLGGVSSGQPAVKPMTEYQKKQTELRSQQLGLDKERLELDQELKTLKAKEQQATDALRREKIQKEIAEKEGKLDELDKQKDNALANSRDALNVVNEILNDESLDNITGTLTSRTPTVRGTSQDLINKVNRLQSLLTVDNLKLMTGVLTDKDIGFLTNVSSGLNVTENGIKGSVKGVRERLGKIAKKLQDRISEAGGSSQSTTESKQAPSAAVDYLKANPQFKEQFKQKYGYLPEGF